MIDPGHLRADRCPGLLSPHQAEDGLLVRIRVPGGRLTTDQLAGLGRLAAEYGQPELQLTSRANVQLRGIAADRLEGLSDDVAALGLLPSPDHERVRNIVASPLAGLNGRPDLAPLIAELDQALCADPELAALPGRFLFVLDDGSGDLSSLRCDLGLRVLTSDTVLIMVGTDDEPIGSVLPIAHAVSTMIMIARRFVELRRDSAATGWHLREVDPSRLVPGWRPISELDVITDGGPAGRAPTPVGVIDGAASVLVPLARLASSQIDALVSAADTQQLILTPWRGVIVPGAATRLPSLAAAGLIIDDASAWNGVTACVGSPGCARSAIDTRRTATELVDLLQARPAATPQRIHLSGCDRRCGRPAGQVTDLVAPADARTAYAALDLDDLAHDPGATTERDEPTAGSV